MNKSSHKHSRLTYVAIVTLFLSALAFSGCHTMKGAGKDIENAGEKIQDKAS